MSKVWGILFLVSFGAQSLWAAPPPARTLTLDFVLNQAVKSSGSAKAVAAQSMLSEAARHRADQNLNWNVELSYEHQDDKHEEISATAVQRSLTNVTELTMSKYFVTGTDLSLSLTSSDNKLTYTSSSTDYLESQASLSLSQNLWQDFLGSSTRKSRNAYLWDAVQQEQTNKMTIDNWYLGVVDQFYAAWLAKQTALASQVNRERREKLERVIRQRVQRAASDSEDLLQAQSATNSAKVEEMQRLQGVQDLWRSLIVILGLPTDWQNQNPLQFSIAMDQPMVEADKVCRTQQPKEYFALQAQRAEKEAADLRMAAAKDSMRPDVELYGTYALNGVDPSSRSETVKEVTKSEHPDSMIGVVFKMPIGHDAAEAVYKDALVKQIQTAASLSDNVNQNALTWKSQCESLKRLTQKRELYENSFNAQSRRARLEERRYGIGRTTVTELIQAQDDATEAEVQLFQAEVELRRMAWQVLKFNHAVFEKFNQLSKK